MHMMDRSNIPQSECHAGNIPLESSGVVAGAGLVGMDLLITDRDDQPIKRWAGGSCGNVLTILSTLNWDSFPIARLGRDEPAVIIRKDLEYWGVKTRFATSTSTGSSPIIIQRNNHESHTFEFRCPDCRARLPRFKRPLLDRTPQYISELPAANVFYFDRAVPAALRLAEYFRSNGALVIFEPNNSTDRDLFERGVNVSHILKYTKDTKIRLRDVDHPWLHIETLGPDGLRFRINGGAWTERDAYKTDTVADTSGAGDWCSAGLLHILGRYWSGDPNMVDADLIDRGLSYGQALAALNCLFEGARGALYGIPRDKLSRALERPADILGNAMIINSNTINGIEHPHTNVPYDRATDCECLCEAICNSNPSETYYR